MNRILVLILFFVSTQCKQHGLNNQELGNDLIASDKEVTLVFETEGYTEGIVFDNEGYGYISHKNEILKFDSLGNYKPWAKLSKPNGHKILPNGTHVICVTGAHSIAQYSSSGQFIKNLSTKSETEALRAPNDLALDQYGGIYFTDARGYGGNFNKGSVHYIDSLGQTFTIDKNLDIPNGIAVSNNGKTLFVALSGKNQILKYTISSPGQISQKRIFSNLPDSEDPKKRILPDGIKTDKFDNLYIAHYGTGNILVLNKKGELIHQILSGHQIVSNLEFNSDGHIYTTGCINERPGKGGVFKANYHSSSTQDIFMK